MQQLILKNDISPSKIEALIYFLKSWDIDAELQTSPEVSSKNQIDFSLSVGLWKDRAIDVSELRKQAWSRKS